jgi:molybdopterin-containing oxidoreductase family iron-sulfur binding subunit
MGMAKRLGMVIDLARCIGCHTCALACKLENNVSLGLAWNRVLTIGGPTMDTPKGQYPDLSMYHFTIACQHCENPVCVKVCPTGASYQREDGICLVNYDACIGCRYCLASCPYSARVFNSREPQQIPDFPIGNPDVKPRDLGVVEKCTFCVHRVDKGILEPACVEVCPARARFFGDLNDPESEVSRLIMERNGYQLLPELGRVPKVYFLPPRRKGYP